MDGWKRQEEEIHGSHTPEHLLFISPALTCTFIIVGGPEPPAGLLLLLLLHGVYFNGCCPPPSCLFPTAETQKSCLFSACLAAAPVEPMPTGQHLRPRLDFEHVHNINNRSKEPAGPNRWSKSVSTPPSAALLTAKWTSHRVQPVCSGVNVQVRNRTHNPEQEHEGPLLAGPQ